MTDSKPRRHFIRSAADVWPLTDDLSRTPLEDGEVVILEGREILAEQLVSVFRWLFDK